MCTYNQNYVHIDIVIWYIHIYKYKYIWIIGFMSFIIVKCLLCNGNTTSSAELHPFSPALLLGPWGEARGKSGSMTCWFNPWNMEQMHIGLRYSYIWQIFYIQLLGIICHIWISIPNNWIELVFLGKELNLTRDKLGLDWFMINRTSATHIFRYTMIYRDCKRKILGTGMGWPSTGTTKNIWCLDERWDMDQSLWIQ